MREIILLGALAVFGGAPSAHAQADAVAPQTGLPRVAITAGLYVIDAQVALTEEQRRIGLMGRQQLAPSEGMLFVFEQPGIQCFWMKNTPLPLTTAFIADDGTIVNLANMQPMSTQTHCSAKPVRFVLEMQQGWFAKRGIRAGQRLMGTPFAPK